MKELKIYIDGSHLNKQNNGRLGIGGILVDPSKSTKGESITYFSKELTPEYIKSRFETDKCSNPSAELIALLHALIEFENDLKKANKITVLADYIGVRDWMTGKWKVKEPYIVKIKNEIDSKIKSLNLQDKIEYVWVPAHQKDNSIPDVYWNNQVDLLAKGK